MNVQIDAGESAEVVLATIRPGGDRDHICYRTRRPSENIAEEPCT